MEQLRGRLRREPLAREAAAAARPTPRGSRPTSRTSASSALEVVLAGLDRDQQRVERGDVDPDRVVARLERLHERRARAGERVEHATAGTHVPRRAAPRRAAARTCRGTGAAGGRASSARAPAARAPTRRARGRARRRAGSASGPRLGIRRREVADPREVVLSSRPRASTSSGSSGSSSATAPLPSGPRRADGHERRRLVRRLAGGRLRRREPESPLDPPPEPPPAHSASSGCPCAASSACSRRIRSSIGGCVEKSADMPVPA